MKPINHKKSGCHHGLSILGLILLAFLPACSQESGSTADPSANNTITTSIPIGSLSNLCTEKGLTAEIIVDENEPIVLDIDCETERARGIIPDLSPGTHTFTINYYLDEILIVTASSTTEIVAGQEVTVAFEQDSFTFPDSDGDGITNLAEIESGTDPEVATSRPSIGGSRTTTNYVLADQIGRSPMVGRSNTLSYGEETGIPNFEGTASTTANYTLR